MFECSDFVYSGFDDITVIIFLSCCNFLINTGSASASDIERLGQTLKQTVYQKTGITLEWEVQIVGQEA